MDDKDKNNDFLEYIINDLNLNEEFDILQNDKKIKAKTKEAINTIINTLSNELCDSLGIIFEQDEVIKNLNNGIDSYEKENLYYCESSKYLM